MRRTWAIDVLEEVQTEDGRVVVESDTWREEIQRDLLAMVETVLRFGGMIAVTGDREMTEREILPGVNEHITRAFIVRYESPTHGETRMPPKTAKPEAAPEPVAADPSE